MFAFNAVGRGFCLIDEVGVENVELVALDNFWWRVVMIIVRLVVLVPLVPHLHPVEVPRLARSVLAGPLWLRTRANRLLAREYLFVFTDSFSKFSLVKSFRRLREILVGNR